MRNARNGAKHRACENELVGRTRIHWLVAGACVLSACRPDATAPVPALAATPPAAQVTWVGGELTCGALGFAVSTFPTVLAPGQAGDARMVNPANATGGTTWSSTDTAVATVAATSDNWRGVTTGVDAGWSCIKVVVTNSSSGSAGQARVAVPGVRVTPKSIELRPGDSQQLTVAAAVASDGSAMPTSTVFWSVTDQSLASVDPSGSVFAQQVGATTVVATVNGISKSVPLTVLPIISLSGPARINANAYGTFTASVSGCNTVCTYQWSILWTDALHVTHSQLLGTAATQTVQATMPASPPQFEIDVAVTTNGVSRYAVKNVYIATTGGCTVKTGC